MIKRVGNRELVLLLVAATLVLVAGAAAIVSDNVPDWKYYQSEFRAILAERVGDVDPAQVPTGVQQIWVRDLNRVDRCTTCHLGV